jgi:hypothetical protein
MHMDKDMQDFINQNRAELQKAILKMSPGERLDDDNIELWILNDPGLYNWAQAEGVNV